MLKEKIANKLLIQRNGHWYYQRRVPRKYSHVDPRNMVKKSLETRSIDVARMRRDALVEADNEYWRTLYGAFFKYYGDENRQNPFRNVFFKGETKSSVAPFDDKWVREKILRVGLFDDLRVELKVMIYVLIETGARMSEVCNLMPEDIRLGETVPYNSYPITSKQRA